jgi:hypothetical protein
MNIRFACGKGNLSVAQWLYSLHGIDIHIWDNIPFHFACQSGRLLVAQ